MDLTAESCESGTATPHTHDPTRLYTRHSYARGYQGVATATPATLPRRQNGCGSLRHSGEEEAEDMAVLIE